MTNDPLSPYAPARVRGLLIPSGRIKKSRFNDFCKHIQSESWVKLGNVRPSPRSQRTIFSPQNAPNGTVFFELSSYMPSVSQLALSPFELFREPLVVIGILDSSEYSYLHSTETQKEEEDDDDDDDDDSPKDLSPFNMLDNALAELKEKYSKALVHYLLLCDIEKTKGLSKYPENVRAIPPVLSAGCSELENFLCELTSLLLDGMMSYSRTVQALHTIPSPPVRVAASEATTYAGWPLSPDYDMLHPDKFNVTRASIALNGVNTHNNPLSTSIQADNGKNMGSAQNGQRRVLPNRSEHKMPATTFDEIDEFSTLTSSLSSKEFKGQGKFDTGSKKIDVQGFGSGSLSERVRNIGQARIGSVIGQLLLMSGHWSDALNETLQSVVKCKFFNDHLWHARGIETILICLLMQAWAGHELKIPHLCYPESDRFAFRKSISITGSEDYNTSKAATLEAASLQDLAALLPGLLNKVVDIYRQASNSSGECVPQTVFSECIIRFTKILIALSAYHGKVNSDMLHKLLTYQVIAKPQARTANNSVSAPGKDEIVRFLFQAIPANAGALQSDDIAILCGMSLALSDLCSYRKKAFIMRELTSSVVSALIQARRAGAAEMAIHPAASVLASFHDARDNYSKVEDRDSDERLEYFLRYLARLYEIQELKYLVDQPSETASVLQNRTLSLIMSRQSGNLSLKLNILRLCIAFCEALPNFRGISYFSALLLALCGPWASNSSADEFLVNLSKEEQLYLSTNIRKNAEVAELRNSDDIGADYWDDFLLQEVRVIGKKSGGTPLNFHKVNKTSSASGVGDVNNPFIFSNISKKSKIDSTPYLLAGEQCEFYITLRNPYAFEIIVEWLEICSTGARLESHAENIQLSPYNTEQFLIKALPKEAGVMKVEGCKIKIYGCRARHFHILPRDQYHKPSSRNKSILPKAGLLIRKSSNTADGSPKTQDNSSLELKSLRIRVILEQPTVVVKDISVPQAALIMFEGEAKKVSVSLHNNSENVTANYLAVSCLDSVTTALNPSSTEKQILTPQLYEKQYILHKRPISSVLDEPNELLPGQSKSCEFAFTGVKDLTTATIQIDYAHLAVGDSDSMEVYAKRLQLPLAITVIPSIQLQKASILPLPPQYPLGSQILLSQSKVRRGDLLGSHDQDNGRLEKSVTTHKRICHSNPNLSNHEHCMLVLDLQNLWSHPLHASLQLVNQKGGDATAGSEYLHIADDIIDPEDLSRLTVIIPKIYVQNPYAPIPSLRHTKERQFVRKNDRSPTEVNAADLKAFWYREKLLEFIQGSYTDKASGRSGTIDLRGLNLNVDMIEALILDDIAIDITVLGDTQHEDESTNKNDEDYENHDNCYNVDDATQQQQQQQQQQRQQKAHPLSHPKIIVPTNNFLVVRTLLYNRSSSPIHTLLHLQPRLANQVPEIALNLDGRLAFSGTMQKVLPVLGPGESLASEVSFCALARGTYEIGATVKEVRRLRSDRGVECVGGGDGVTHDENTNINHATNTDGAPVGNDAEGRRTWHMREPCCIVAV